MDLQRYQDAYARNAIAKQQLDDQAQTVVQYEGTVKADQGTVAYDEVQLEYCHIVAPIAGRVGLRLVDPGNTVFAGSGSTLIVITQLQPITVVFNVSEDDLPQVQEQLQADSELSVDVFDRANAHLIESGMLASLDNQVDTTTGTRFWPRPLAGRPHLRQALGIARRWDMTGWRELPADRPLRFWLLQMKPAASRASQNSTVEEPPLQLRPATALSDYPSSPFEPPREEPRSRT
jgi:hypothetical protein